HQRQACCKTTPLKHVRISNVVAERRPLWPTPADIHIKRTIKPLLSPNFRPLRRGQPGRDDAPRLPPSAISLDLQQCPRHFRLLHAPHSRDSSEFRIYAVREASTCSCP